MIWKCFCVCCYLTELKRYEQADAQEKYNRKELECISCNDALTSKSKQLKSAAWKNFSRLFDVVANVLVLNFVLCIGCESLVPIHGMSTTLLLRHQQKCKAQRNQNQQNGRSKIDFEATDLKPLRDAAAKFVVMDFRPAFGVEGKGLTQYLYAVMQLSKLYPNMTLEDLMRAMPSRNTVTIHIQKIADESIVMVKEMLKKAISVCGCFGATSDLWTDKHNSTPYITVTAHFFVLTQFALQLKSLVIELKEMVYANMSGDNVRSAIFEIFAGFGITENQLLEHTCIVTDRGSNMLKATKDFDSHACLAHICNNVVSVMLKLPEAKTIVSNASSVVKYVKKSQIGAQMESKLKSHIETRWNSACDMLKSILENYEELKRLLQTKPENSHQSAAFDKLTSINLSELKAMCEFLVLFKNLTMEIEGDKCVTLHKYWPSLIEMKNFLKSERNEIELIKSMKAIGLSYITESENSDKIRITMRHKMACFLFPLWKGLGFATAEDRFQVHSHVQNLIEKDKLATDDHEMASVSNTVDRTNKTSLFQGYFDFNNDNDGSDTRSELDRYITHIVEQVLNQFYSNFEFRKRD